MTIKDLTPSIVWDNFYKITRVPRPSKHEEKIREYLLNWGKEHNLINQSLSSFVINQARLDLQAIKDGDSINYNFDTIKSL